MSHLKFSGEMSCRCVEPRDSWTCVGAFAKGRSSTRALNFECRRAACICFAGRLFPFYVWIASEDNPSDEPSCWFGLRAEKLGGKCPRSPAPPCGPLGEVLGGKPEELHTSADWSSRSTHENVNKTLRNGENRIQIGVWCRSLG